MKKFLTLFFIISLLNMLSGCSNTIDADIIKEGVQPYIMYDGEIKMLKSLALEDKVNIISFKAPKSVKSLEINTYILGEDKTWQSNGGGKISMDKDNNHNDILEGTFTMLLKENYKIEMNVNTTCRYSFQTEELFNDDSTLASAIGFLSDFKEIELNEEIPVAILIYNSGSRIVNYSMESFFSPTDFAEMSLVQAVTLSFKDY